MGNEYVCKRRYASAVKPAYSYEVKCWQIKKQETKYMQLYGGITVQKIKNKKQKIEWGNKKNIRLG